MIEGCLCEICCERARAFVAERRREEAHESLMHAKSELEQAQRGLAQVEALVRGIAGAVYQRTPGALPAYDPHALPFAVERLHKLNAELKQSLIRANEALGEQAAELEEREAEIASLRASQAALVSSLRRIHADSATCDPLGTGNNCTGEYRACGCRDCVAARYAHDVNQEAKEREDAALTRVGCECGAGDITLCTCTAVLAFVTPDDIEDT